MLSLSKKIREVTTDKIAFFTNITHEFRTPITLILGPLERALKLSYNPEVIEQLQIIERNSRSLLSLVNQLLDFRKVDSGTIEIVKNDGDLIHFIEQIILPFQAFARERNITIHTHFKVRDPFFKYDEEWMRKVIINLLSNAIKFTPDYGTVTLYMTELSSLKNEKSYIYISVRDTGNGIPEEDLTKIFDRFYQSKKNIKYPVYGQSGTGIGLYLCKQIIQQHGGTISAKNNSGKGSSFRIILPLERGEKPLPDRPIPARREEISPDSPGEDQKNITLLIVEDNPDMRKYLYSILYRKYTILEAENGLSALDLLKEKNVDFIISDLMMPAMNGLEFSKRVKENLSTSHIPIIMLTAKISMEKKIESYKIGVDEYISKPFDEELLLVRIENILKSQQKHQKEFQFSMDVEVLQIDEESKDKKFLDKVMRVIEENYKDPEFEVPDFAIAIGMSRTLLNRKLQKLTGQSTGQFIRNYRLSLGKELILRNRTTRNMNIPEIAYEVGFNDPKYFAKCFQKHYGLLPSVMLEGS